MENPTGIVLLPEAPATPLSYSSEWLAGPRKVQDKFYLRIVQPPAGELLYSATAEISPYAPPRYASLGFSRDQTTLEGISLFLAKLVHWRFQDKVEPAEARELNPALCQKLENKLRLPPHPEIKELLLPDRF